MSEQLSNNRHRILKAINFIEENLGNEIDLKKIAAESTLSEFHFHRLFNLLVGETPGNYIRRRRLHEASLILTTTGEKIIEVALEYGYSSSDSFSRAFTKHYGFPPKFLKGNKDKLIPYAKPRLLLKNLLHMEKGVSMEPEIKILDSFKLVGVVYYGNPNEGEIPEFWENHFGEVSEISNRIGDECYGFCFHTRDYIEKGKMHYMPAVRVKDFSDIPIKAVAKTVPKHEYAIFTHIGDSEKLEETYNYINGTYFPNKKFKPNESFDFELYTTDEKGNDIIKIYIPIIRL